MDKTTKTKIIVFASFGIFGFLRRVLCNSTDVSYNSQEQAQRKVPQAFNCLRSIRFLNRRAFENAPERNDRAYCNKCSYDFYGDYKQHRHNA